MNLIQDGALLIRDGLVVEVGPTRRVENLEVARGAVEIGAAGRVVMPGFVDSHTHLVFPPAGAEARDLATAASAVRATGAKRLAGRVRSHLEAMVRHGTTTVEVKTGCGFDPRSETKLLRVLAAVKRDPVDVIPTFLLRLPARESCDEAAVRDAVEWTIAEFLPKMRKAGVLRFADFAWEADAARQAIFLRYLEAAARLGLRCKMHADRFDGEAYEAIAAGHPLTSVDHLEGAGPDDAVRIRRRGGVATLLPAASFHSGAGYAPARQLIDAGVPVALASNFNPVETPTLSMQTVVALACTRMGMTPAEAVSAATVNGAHAAGCAETAGTLEHGKAADLLILNVSDYRELGHDFGTNLVHLTMKRGEFIYQEGGVTSLAPADLRLAW